MNQEFSNPFAAQVIGVSMLNSLVRDTLEAALPLLWVGGEVSNLTRAPSGHLYFTLKDAQAQVRCALWRNRAQLLAFRPENGMRVEARVLVTLYETRGDYQLNVESLRPAGIGDLFEAYRRLKDRLAAEGLFDPARRRPIPRFPRGVGIVTSPAAAALHDVLATLYRRAPGLPVVLYPAAVQGGDAPRQLAQALAHAGRRAAEDGIDLILLVRGGGSLEDLWAFNDEALARAIAASPLPVISGVGHETDFTIADFAADLRAATPTGAAELASAGYHAAGSTLAATTHRLQQACERQLQSLAQRLDRAASALVHPRDRLQRARENAARLALRLQRALESHLNETRHRLARLGLRLHVRRPTLIPQVARLDALAQRLRQGARAQLDHRHQTVDALAASLQHLGPQAVLARGYSITRDAAGNILRSATDARAGEKIEVQFAHGRVDARIDTVRE
ncbi:MAG: exodeoxyribonuclease VII large subunit [Azoarcus sp.]|jgi:exodeoxyribonuclease VII large subunit|nr:exodeoxyribonuclease VII large subunit [Azoarcus sp.]